MRRLRRRQRPASPLSSSRPPKPSSSNEKSNYVTFEEAQDSLPPATRYMLNGFRVEIASDRLPDETLRPIAESRRNVILEHPTATQVIKKALTRPNLIANECRVHRRVEKVFEEHREDGDWLAANVYVPIVMSASHIPASARSWHKWFTPYFPKQFQAPNDIHVMELVWGLDAKIMMEMKERFLPEEQLLEERYVELGYQRGGGSGAATAARKRSNPRRGAAMAFTEPEIDDSKERWLRRFFMPRICLGVRGAVGQEGFCMESFDADLDVLENLKIDLKVLAMMMGETLAVLHWVVHTDAAGIKFVLASQARSPLRNPPPSTSLLAPKQAWIPQLSFKIADLDAYVWLMHFDRCKLFPAMNIRNVDIPRLIESILSNPCFPSPNNFEIWFTFRESYFYATRAILRGETGTGNAGDAGDFAAALDLANWIIEGAEVEAAAGWIDGQNVTESIDSNSNRRVTRGMASSGGGDGGRG